MVIRLPMVGAEPISYVPVFNEGLRFHPDARGALPQAVPANAGRVRYLSSPFRLAGGDHQ